MQDEMNELERIDPQDRRWRWASWLSILAVMTSALLVAVRCGNPLVRVHTASPRNACIANLIQIHGAKCTWALENNKTNTAQPTASQLYGPNNYIRDELTCPSGGTYTLGNVGTKPRCSVAGHTI